MLAMDADVRFWIQFIAAVALIGALTSFVIALRRSKELRRRWLFGTGTCSAVVFTAIIAAVAAEHIEEWPFVLAAAIAAVSGISLLLWSLFSDRSRGRRRCPKCWYDMSNAPAEARLRCPECGREARRERQLFKTPRRWRWAAASLLIFIAAAYLGVQPKVRQDGWTSVMPTTLIIIGLWSPDPEWAMDALQERSSQDRWLSIYMADADSLARWQWRWVACGAIRVLKGDHSSSLRRRAIHVADSAAHATSSPKIAVWVADEIAAFANDPSAEVQEFAVMSFSTHPRAEIAIERTLPYLDHPQTRVHRAAIVSLFMTLRKSDLALPHVLRATTHSSSEVRRTAAFALRTYAKDGRDPEPIVDVLASLALGSDHEVRSRAIAGLLFCQGHEERAKAIVHGCLASADPTTRGHAISALADAYRREVPFAAGCIVAALEDTDPGVRMEAANALGTLNESQLQPHIQKIRELVPSLDAELRDIVTISLRDNAKVGID